MGYTQDEVLQYVREDDVKFVRLAFCDVFGTQKNISIMADELPRAFEQGIAIDGSAIAGFSGVERSDLILHPDAATLVPLPWRPEHGRVVQLFSSIVRPDGSAFPCDTRALLARAVERAAQAGIVLSFGAEQEFYLFELDEQGRPTQRPCDSAGYMDIAPEDRGENVRREVCLTLERMGVHPESSHHEEGPGQNEIDFRYADAITAADNTMMFQRVVRTIAHRNGLCADFSAKPLEHAPGNGFHINMAPHPFSEVALGSMVAGILSQTSAMTLFLNPTEGSYRRLGGDKAPAYVSWSAENRSQLVRIPAAMGEYRRAELRSPDPSANPYIAFALLIHAALDGMKGGLALPEPCDIDLFSASAEMLEGLERLPTSLAEARAAASASAFVAAHVPAEVLTAYLRA